ncbi:MAG: hypothetical protein IKT14_06470 [Clostridiales bacterium]|nr:hypothetical protein [Clostridiales bacterium]MBR6484647.1 hypothetical protein [Clostridiales bacterium]
MMQDNYGNYKDNGRRRERNNTPVYLICMLIIVLCLALDVYFIMEMGLFG